MRSIRLRGVQYPQRRAQDTLLLHGDEVKEWTVHFQGEFGSEKPRLFPF